MLTIIADCGATKTEWGFIRRDNSGNAETVYATTVGMNVATTSAADIRQTIVRAIDQVPWPELIATSTVRFYGAGCIGSGAEAMRDLLRETMRAQHVEVESDMVAAARALFGSEAGIACILGTGSNSCMYDGTRIVDNIPPMGWILGDEGSGAYIGKELVNSVFKRLLPDKIISAFSNRFNLTYPELVERIYRRPDGNRFLASFMPFVADNIDEPAIEELVVRAFSRFVDRNILSYNSSLPVGFCGSLAHHFKHQLHMVLDEFGLQAGRIIAKPLPALVELEIGR